MPTTETESEIPKVFIGCFECHNAGELIGQWYPAINAERVTTDQVHGRKIPPHTHEELWVFYCENMLSDYQMDLNEATQQAKLLASVDPLERDALRAWAATGTAVEDEDGLPDLEVFHDRYRGEWDNFQEYADGHIENVGLLDGFPIELRKYFDHAAYARDLEHDYTVSPTKNGNKVHIFSND